MCSGASYSLSSGSVRDDDDDDDDGGGDGVDGGDDENDVFRHVHYCWLRICKWATATSDLRPRQVR